MLTASVNAPDVRDYMKRLTAQRAALQTDWAARNEQLKSSLDMQVSFGGKKLILICSKEIEWESEHAEQ